MEGSPSPNIHSQVHRAALRQSHGLADGKQPGAERQSYPCCCPKGFLCSTGLLFKLMFCLALKSKFFKGRGCVAAACSTAGRAARGSWQGCFSGSCWCAHLMVSDLISTGKCQLWWMLLLLSTSHCMQHWPWLSKSMPATFYIENMGVSTREGEGEGWECTHHSQGVNNQHSYYSEHQATCSMTGLDNIS